MNWLEGITWARPAGLLLLLWIVLIVWRLRRKSAPRAIPTGTIDLWRSVVGEGAPVAADTRRQIPPRAWLWFLGILAASLAVVDLQRTDEPLAPLYVVLVDRSPSMFLPVEAGENTTRYERALDMTREWLEDQSILAQSREWRALGEPALRAELPPKAWSRAPSISQPEIGPESFEDEHLTVLTDRARDTASGLVASGGSEVFGWVAEREGHALLWDGVLVRQDSPLPARQIAAGASLTEPVRELFRIWAEERGYVLESEAKAQHVFQLGPGIPGAAQDPRSVWVESLPAQEAPEDPAFWAVQWAERLDAAMPVRKGMVSLAERRAAGEPVMRPGGATPGQPISRGTPAAAWLALLSLLCALGAFWPGLGHRGTSRRAKGPRAGLAPSPRSL